MDKKITKSGLAILLSKLDSFRDPQVNSEQYPTPSEIAAEVLWQAHMIDDFTRKVSVDLGSGTGILGLGSLILGAKQVFLVESESSAMEISKKNAEIVQKQCESESSQVIFCNTEINKLHEKADIVLQNPPFGTKVRHADREFLLKAMETAPIIYSFHKSESQAFIHALSKDQGYVITHTWNFDFPLKVSMKHHKKPVKYIRVSCFRLEKLK